MKTINNFITEKLRIGKSIKTYKYFPKTKEELKKILEERLAEDKNANLNDIDVSEITNMNSLFEFLDPHNIDISVWDVSKVTNMAFMFNDCNNFNSDLSNWDVSKVINMRGMFYGCTNFNSDLSGWEVDEVKDMNSMFYNCQNFNSDLSKWNVSNVRKNVRNMEDMFGYCTSLKNKPSWYK